jgi:hypothetical protein
MTKNQSKLSFLPAKKCLFRKEEEEAEEKEYTPVFKEAKRKVRRDQEMRVGSRETGDHTGHGQVLPE